MDDNYFSKEFLQERFKAALMNTYTVKAYGFELSQLEDTKSQDAIKNLQVGHLALYKLVDDLIKYYGNSSRDVQEFENDVDELLKCINRIKNKLL